MNAKLYARFSRFALNFMPCIWGGGGRVTYLSDDFTRLTVRLPLSIRTRNIMGTIFGGSMYASTDPMFMLMLMHILGKNFVVWDKGCTIRFKRPAKKTLFAEFHITSEMLAKVKNAVAENFETRFTWTIAYKDEQGIVYAEFDKVLYVATKAFYVEKQKRRGAHYDPGQGIRS